MNFNYIQNVNEEVAEIRIYKRIGASFEQDGVNGSDFANEMAWLQDKCKKINVRINSGGGNVIDSYAIINSILNSKVPCDTYIDGIAASAAASIAVAGRKVYMVDYGVFMIHNATDPQNEAAQEILDVFNKSINTLLTNRTKLTAEEIGKMMTAETWMDAQECLACGMVDAIVSTEKKVKLKPTASVMEAYAICNELLNEKKPNMKNINNELSIAVDNADESLVVNSIKELKNKLETITAENTALKAEKAESIEKAKTALVDKATALVNKAKEDKKITDEEVAGMIANASRDEASYDFVASMIAKISNVKPAEKIFNQAEATEEEKAKAAWTYKDWTKNDPQGLLKMQNENPAMFEALVKTIPTELKSK